MINRNEIEKMAETLGVHTSHVQRDYVNGWLISLLYSSSGLADNLVLKGGNCLRKGYFENSRYSSDLDFTTANRISDEEIGRELNAICSALNDRVGLAFDTSKTRVNPKKRADSEKNISEAQLYFRDFYGKKSKMVLSVKLDVSQFDRLYLPVQERFLIHPYSDSEQCTTQIRCVKLEEILATKMRCLLQRKHIADLFDLVFATIFDQDIDVNRTELITTFFRITIFGSSPSVAKGLFIDLPLEALERFWSKYIQCPKISRFDFAKAKENFFAFINSLIPDEPTRTNSSIFFPSSLRNPIMEAADSLTMVKLTYSNIERLVEPYELAFKFRKDNTAREYFYGYDVVGGHSGPGIKAFLPDRIQKIENTDLKFDPRFPVELSKAGGAETVSRFESKSSTRSYGVLPKKPRRIRRPRSSVLNRGIEYQVQCPYCNKRFKRKKRDTKLNPHKDRFGNPCHARRGWIV